MKAVVAAFNQEKALVGAFSVITNLRMDLFQALQASGQWSDVPQPRVMLLMSRVKGADQQGIGVTGGGGREKVVLISYCFI